MKKLLTLGTVASLFFLPLAAIAESGFGGGSGNSISLTDIISTAADVVLLSVPWLLVMVAFFWNLASLVFNIGDAEKNKQAKQRLIWAIIAMFVLFTFPGIINLLGRTFFDTPASESTNSFYDFNPQENGPGNGSFAPFIPRP